jgi:hypothetical protein
MQARNLGHEQFIAQLPRGRRPAHRGAIAARGQESSHCRPEDLADELNRRNDPGAQ